MEKAKFKKQYQRKKSKHSEEWKEQGEKMTEWFNQNCYHIFHRTQRVYIDEAFRICKEKDIHNIGYFWAIVKNNQTKAKEYEQHKR